MPAPYDCECGREFSTVPALEKHQRHCDLFGEFCRCGHQKRDHGKTDPGCLAEGLMDPARFCDCKGFDRESTGGRS